MYWQASMWGKQDYQGEVPITRTKKPEQMFGLLSWIKLRLLQQQHLVGEDLTVRFQAGEIHTTRKTAAVKSQFMLTTGKVTVQECLNFPAVHVKNSHRCVTIISQRK